MKIEIYRTSLFVLSELWNVLGGLWDLFVTKISRVVNVFGLRN